MFMKNCWYVASWSSGVAMSQLLSRTILNEKILFYRGTTGQIIAIEDQLFRCHRGAMLSLGRLFEGDCVRCMYHGLLFDASAAASAR